MKTPMELLKNQFDEFKIITKQKGFQELALNKSEPKTTESNFCGDREIHYNRGVKSDFIKVFSIENENAYRIGFVFRYIDLAEEDQSVSISLRNDTSAFYKTRRYPIKYFQKILNKVINEMKLTEDLNYEKIINLIKDNFEFKAGFKKNINKKLKK